MRLNNGLIIPQIGVGTWTLRGETARQNVRLALQAGFRHVDTAQMYENAPQQDGQKTDLTKENKNMTNGELREKLALALEDMKAKAIEMGIEGVATASVLNCGDTVDWIAEDSGRVNRNALYQVNYDLQKLFYCSHAA